jgi:prophage regulatory protein
MIRTRAGDIVGDTGPVQRIYRRSELGELTGYHIDYIRQLVRDGRFPKPISLGGPGSRAKGWLASDIAAWQRQRIAERDGEAA